MCLKKYPAASKPTLSISRSFGAVNRFIIILKKDCSLSIWSKKTLGFMSTLRRKLCQLSRQFSIRCSHSATAYTTAFEHHIILPPVAVSSQQRSLHQMEKSLKFRLFTQFSSPIGPAIPSHKSGCSTPSSPFQHLSPQAINHTFPAISLQQSISSKISKFLTHLAGHFLPSSSSPVCTSTSAPL